VARTVHGLQSVLRLLRFEHEHVFFVIPLVPGDLPEFSREHVRGDDLVEASDSLFLAHNVHHFVLQKSALGKEEGRAGGVAVVHEQLVVFPHLPVVTFLGFLKSVDLLFHLVFGGECCTLHPLQVVVAHFAQPVGS